MAKLTKAKIKEHYQSIKDPSTKPEIRAIDQHILGIEFYLKISKLLNELSTPFIMDDLRAIRNTPDEEPTTQEYISFLTDEDIIQIYKDILFAHDDLCKWERLIKDEIDRRNRADKSKYRMINKIGRKRKGVNKCK